MKDTLPIAVASLAARISAKLWEFPTVSVRGRLSKVTASAAGHCYFTVSDPSGGISFRCVMWRRFFKTSKVAPVNGMAAVVTGRVELRGDTGCVQLRVTRVAVWEGES